MNFSESFDALSARTITEMVSRNLEETLHLDFKTVRDASVHGDDRRNLARAISGFANAAGGIIVWGVDARKGTDGVDCAQAIVPISPINLFLSRLSELTADSASPAVAGVRHRAFVLDGDRGLAATLVPESASGPHMAKLTEDRYYKRNGTSFRKMEHFDLEDMFGRRQRPDLYLTVSRVPFLGETEKIEFRMLNKGRAIARHSGLFVRFPDWVVLQSVENPLRDISNFNAGLPTVAYDDNISVIHPNNVVTSVGAAIIQAPKTSAPLTLRLKLYCDGMTLKEEEFTIS